MEAPSHKQINKLDVFSRRPTDRYKLNYEIAVLVYSETLCKLKLRGVFNRNKRLKKISYKPQYISGCYIPIFRIIYGKTILRFIKTFLLILKNHENSPFNLIRYKTEESME